MKKIILFLFFVILSTGCSFNQMIEENNAIQVNDQEVEEIPEKSQITQETIIKEEPKQEEETCEDFGDFKIGDFCCRGTEKIFLCEQDVDLYESKLDLARGQSWPTLKQIVRLDDPKISFQQPEGWKIMKKYKSGIFDVPISYFIEDGFDFYEIRLLVYDKGDLSLKEIEDSLFKMISKREKLRGADVVHVYDADQVWIDKSYWIEIDYCLDMYTKTKCGDEDDFVYYNIDISPYKNKYYIWLYRDPSYREFSSGDKDKRINQFSDILKTFNFWEETVFEKEEKFKDDIVGYYSLDFKNPTTVRYDIVSEGNLDVYFVNNFDAFMDYIESFDRGREKFEFYEGCNFRSVQDIKGECIITTGGLMISNMKDGYNNVKIKLDWS